MGRGLGGFDRKEGIVMMAYVPDLYVYAVVLAITGATWIALH